MTIRILAFAASTREGSYNRQLLPVVVAGARQAGAEVTTVDLRDYRLPVYDGDLEAAAGLPAAAAQLQLLIGGHQGLLVVTPEYNASYPPLLKNTLDWVSRPDASGAPGLRHIRGKVAAIAAASPGHLGGIRSLLMTRQFLGHLGFIVLPRQFALTHAGEAFDDKGAMKDPDNRAAAEAVGAELAGFLGRLRQP